MRSATLVTLFLSTLAIRAAADDAQPLCPPAVPLVAHDPYFQHLVVQ